MSSLGSLLDDAALFPPGNAPMPVAVAAHRYHLGEPHADLIGPFLCPVDRVRELRAELRTGDRIRVGLIAAPDRADRADLADLAEAAAAVDADDRLELDRVELPLDPAGVAPTAAALDLDPDVPAYLELPWTAAGRAALDELRARRGPRILHAKFRTGGAVVPPVDALAERIVACHRGVPVGFKCTAGLHAAVRHDDAHGFLNVLVAAGTAARGAPVAEVAAVLAETSADRLVARLREADTTGAFHSFGSCSITEPLADMVALGLWSAP
ncbi:MAG TPA: hypothetical protein VE547_21090 [Mycobacteriales bacterium]|nr:hypothetical protein [Mycobacteriales bacterium]